MATCQLLSSQVILNKNDVETSVSSYVGSTKYLRKIVPLSITNLLYHRSDLDRELFESKSVESFKFFTFSNKKKNLQSYAVHKWCKNAMEALEKKYLKQLFFIILKAGTDTVLEIYKYKFTYNEEVDQTSLKPTPNQVLQHTVDFFDGIKALGENSKLPKDIEFKVELTFYEDVPGEYQPPTFESIGNKKPYLNVFQESNSYIKVGSIDSGYHLLRCFGKSNMFGMSRPMTPASNINANDVDDNVTIVSMSERDVQSPISVNDKFPPSSVDIAVRCCCSLQFMIEEISMVKCTICEHKQHAACMNFFNDDEIPSAYVCPYCGDEGFEVIDRRLQSLSMYDRQIISLFRLTLMYTYYTDKVAYVILNELDMEIQQCLWKKLKNTSVYYYENELWHVHAREKVVQIIKQMFQKLPAKKPEKRPNSLRLDSAPFNNTEDSMVLPEPRPTKKRTRRI